MIRTIDYKLTALWEKINFRAINVPMKLYPENLQVYNFSGFITLTGNLEESQTHTSDSQN